MIIIDDILKPDDALSEIRRKAANDWYFNTLLSRLNSKENGVIIIVMQRLHQGDLVGEVTDREHWDTVDRNRGEVDCFIVNCKNRTCNGHVREKAYSGARLR